MQDKFDIYDVLGVLIPGVLVVAAVQLAFPMLAKFIPEIQLPEGFAFVIVTSLSVFTGYLVQALASLCEPVLYKTWGGRPSENALDYGLGERYFPVDTGKRIKHKLQVATDSHATSRSLFLYAMQIAESCGSARVSRFNALYAYHRALLFMNVVALFVFIASFYHGLASTLSWKQNAVTLALLALLTLLFWNRARQRGYYYVREVLLCAEQQISSKTEKGS